MTSTPDSAPTAGETPTFGERVRRLVRAPGRRALSTGMLGLGLVLVALAGLLYWQSTHPGPVGIVAAQQPTQFPTSTAAPSPLPTATVEATVTPAATASALPLATLAPSATRTPAPSPTPTRPRADAPPDRIVIPSIKVDSPVIEVGWREVMQDGVTVIEWDVASEAAGFHRGSAYPGNEGNTVISGHHNIKGEVFRYLVNVQVGDEVDLYVGKTVFRYRVESKEIIPEKYASEEQRQENARRIGYMPEDRLTLVTCWPYTSNTHRVIVVAKPLY